MRQLPWPDIGTHVSIKCSLKSTCRRNIARPRDLHLNVHYCWDKTQSRARHRAVCFWSTKRTVPFKKMFAGALLQSPFQLTLIESELSVMLWTGLAGSYWLRKALMEKSLKQSLITIIKLSPAEIYFVKVVTLTGSIGGEVFLRDLIFYLKVCRLRMHKKPQAFFGASC